jgi:hypothetical protein
MILMLFPVSLRHSSVMLGKKTSGWTDMHTYAHARSPNPYSEKLAFDPANNIQTQSIERKG